MNENLLSDNQLIQRFKEGDGDAFQEIYEKYVPELLNYATLKLSSLEESRDMIQDIFLNFYERRSKIKLECSIRSYLFGALRHKIIDHIRRNKQKQYYANMLLSFSNKSEENTFKNLVYKDLNTVLNKGISCLPNRLRETFILSRKEHLSIAEIAAKRNISEQTVKNQLTTAMKKLRPLMEKVMMVLVVLYFLF